MRKSNFKYVDASLVKAWIHDDLELALIDVREHGQYGNNHLFFAVPIAYSKLELEIFRLVPNFEARIVLYGEGDGADVVEASAAILARLGYRDISVLADGVEAWQQAGYSTFAGVHVPSKTFGELTAHVYATPQVSATELQKMLSEECQDVLVLDGRPIDEYRKMTIPGAICCPNGELPLRVGALAPSPDTTIVVNCAGRTRSIIGAQTLINLGIPNKVYALENGTQGWYLADYPLEHQSDRVYPREVSEACLPASRDRARALAHRFMVPSVDGATVRSWLQDGNETVFICDVRTEEEYRRGGLPSIVQHTPGGQLVQATDQYLGVRKARVVLYDSDGIRAPVVSSWLKQFGWKVCLLSDLGSLAGLPDLPIYRATLKNTRVLDRDALAPFMKRWPDALVLDARPSQEYRRLRLRGAQWVVRPTLLAKAAGHESRTVLLLGDERGKLELLAHDLEQSGFIDINLIVMNTAELLESGLPNETAQDILLDDACIDYLFFVHDRHDGNKAAARKYLEWETNLVSRLDEREAGSFSVGYQTTNWR